MVNIGDSTYVGKGIPSIYGIEKVTGRAVYTYDLTFPQMLHLAITRSSAAHALIKRIDKSRAEAINGVVAVYTAEHLPKGLHGRGLLDTPILARGKVRYVGDPVAAVVASSPDVALAAAELVEVEYEPLRPIYDAKESAEEAPTIVHEDLPRYRRYSSKLYRVAIEERMPNVSAIQKISFGDVHEAFKKADFVVSNTYTTQPVHHCHLEPTSIIAKEEPDGSITVYTSGQTPFRTRKEIADALEMPERKIRVIVPRHVGGGFGNRGAAVLEPLVAAVALKTNGRPVKLILSRLEEMMYTTVRHSTQIEISDAVSKDGFILGRLINVYYNGGAYSVAGNVVVRNAVYAISSVYKIPNLKAEIYRVYTNLVQGGAFRGFGSPQIYWAVESQMDEIARRSGIDPIEFRLKNILRDGDVSCIGEEVKDDTMEMCIRKMQEILASRPRPSREGWLTGKGIAIAKHQCDITYPSIALLRLNEDLSFNLYVGATDVGQGIFTGLAQIVAEEFNVPPDRVLIISSDTLLTPLSTGSSGSRQIVQLGNAVLSACRDLKRQIIQAVSKILDTPIESIGFEKGCIKISKDGGVQYLTLDNIFRSGPMGGAYISGEGLLIGRGFFYEEPAELDPWTGAASKPKVALEYTPICTAVDVAVDPETGVLKVLRITVVTDVGKAINHSLVEGQLIGGVWMGFSTSLFEELLIKDGQVHNGTFMDYLIPTAADSPPIEVIVLESGLGPGPFGSRSVGELGVVSIAPAIGNALRDAAGIRVFSLPITPEKIFYGLKAAPT